jgi:hypothetical protein
MYIFKKQTWFTAGLLLTLTACGGDGDTAATTTTSVDVFDGAAIGCSVSSGGITATEVGDGTYTFATVLEAGAIVTVTGCTDADTQSLLPTLSGVPQSGAVVASPITTLIVEAAIANDVAVNSVDLGAGAASKFTTLIVEAAIANDVAVNGVDLGAGAASKLVGPTGPAGLGTVVFNFAPTVNDDMNSSYSLGTVWIDTSAAKPYILVDSSAGAAVWTVLGGSATGSSATGSLYAIGDTGPAGGIVFHVTDGGLHGLEAATVDQEQAPWGCNGTSILHANGTAVGTGEQNTVNIIAGCDGTTAASVAAAYGPGWYLPSKDELNLLYAQRVAGVVGGFSHLNYWSSSQDGFEVAWTQYFDDGFQGAYHKANNSIVRAIRAF